LGEQHGIGDAPAALGAATFVNAFHRGGLENFRNVLEKFAETVPEIAAWTFGAGLAAAADRDYESARAQLERGAHALTETPEELWLPSLCLAAELTGWIGAESPLVTRLTQMLEPYAGQIVIAAALASDFGPTDRSLGLLAAASGDLETAEGHFRAALELCGRLQALPWELRTRTDWLIAERSAGLPARPWWSGFEDKLRAAGLNGAIARLRISQI
jgi:tetratricopeptide (TPR) repeat protein